MRRIRSSRVNVDWLQGPGPTDLWVWHEVPGEAPGTTLVELTFYGRFVMKRGPHVSTGRCDPGTGSPYAQETEVLDLDPALDPVTLAAAEKILRALPEEVAGTDAQGLLAAVRASLAEMVVGAPTGGPKEPNG